MCFRFVFSKAPTSNMSQKSKWTKTAISDGFFHPPRPVKPTFLPRPLILQGRCRRIQIHRLPWDQIMWDGVTSLALPQKLVIKFLLGCPRGGFVGSHTMYGIYIYIYLHEWLVFHGKNMVNVGIYHTWMLWDWMVVLVGWFCEGSTWLLTPQLANSWFLRVLLTQRKKGNIVVFSWFDCDVCVFF